MLDTILAPYDSNFDFISILEIFNVPVITKVIPLKLFLTVCTSSNFNPASKHLLMMSILKGLLKKSIIASAEIAPISSI